MKIAVIGAGWMGAHISNVLNIKRYDVKIFESKKKIFLGMSGYNTNRLHMGYHYPRSLITRKQSINGYNKFIKEYPNLYKKITNIFLSRKVVYRRQRRAQLVQARRGAPRRGFSSHRRN